MVAILLIFPILVLAFCGLFVLAQIILETVEWHRLRRRTIFSIFCCESCQTVYDSGNDNGRCPNCGRANRPLNF